MCSRVACLLCASFHIHQALFVSCLQVLIDLKEIAAGSLYDDWDFLAPKVQAWGSTAQALCAPLPLGCLDSALSQCVAPA